MTTLTIITGDHKTGKTTRADEILNTHHATVVIDEVERRIDLNALDHRDMVVVMNVPSDVTVKHEHLTTKSEEEVEWRLTGFPNCDRYHPSNEAEALEALRRAKQNMEVWAQDYAAAGDTLRAGEMRRRVANASIESRVITEWKPVEL